MQKIYSIITQFNPYHQDDLWALVVYRTPGESTTRYLVQVEKQLKMVHHYFFSSSDSSNPDVLYALDSGKILVSIYAFFLGICQSVHKS